MECLSLQGHVNTCLDKHAGIRLEHTFRILAQQCKDIFGTVVSGHTHPGALNHCPEACLGHRLCLVYLCVSGLGFFPGTESWRDHHEADAPCLPASIFLPDNGYAALQPLILAVGISLKALSDQQ